MDVPGSRRFGRARSILKAPHISQRLCASFGSRPATRVADRPRARRSRLSQDRRRVPTHAPGLLAITGLRDIDPLNHLQLDLLRRHRAGDDYSRIRHAIHLTINGIASGLRNSG